MSILIKGMDMPRNCHECVFGKYEVCAINISVEKNDTITHSCPLTEMPTPHGRLIDADKLNEEVRLLIKENVFSRDDARDLLETISDAPTVIPAEEGK